MELLWKSTVYSKLAERFDLGAYAYAHRGLWSDRGPTENSLDAFLMAADLGFGIEFDVRPAADGVPIIFHDPQLDRMTHESGPVEQRAASDLLGLSLKGSGEIISLSALLDAWPAQTPLLCGMKIDGATNPPAFCARVAILTAAHKGPAAMMSFSIEAVASIPDSIMRGQLIAPTNGDPSADLASTARVTVDYLACHTGDAANPSLQTARAATPLITWTVKDAEMCADLSKLTDSQIFEGFDPKLAKRHILNR